METHAFLFHHLHFLVNPLRLHSRREQEKVIEFDHLISKYLYISNHYTMESKGLYGCSSVLFPTHGIHQLNDHVGLLYQHCDAKVVRHADLHARHG